MAGAGAGAGVWVVVALVLGTEVGSSKVVVSDGIVEVVLATAVGVV